MKTEDEELQRYILEELEWDPGVNTADIGVTVKNGVVTLKGRVCSLAKKLAVEKVVKEFPGVKAIAVDLEVKIPGCAERTDSDLAMAAENTLRWDVLVPNDQIKATLDHGLLTLEGEVERQFQKRAAEQAVSRLTGVIGVNNLITIKPKVAPPGSRPKSKRRWIGTRLLTRRTSESRPTEAPSHYPGWSGPGGNSKRPSQPLGRRRGFQRL